MAAADTRRLKYAVEACINGIWGDEPNGADDLVVVRVADFDRERCSVELGDSPTVRAVPESARSRRLLRRGDLLIEKSGGGEQQPVGNVVLFDEDVPAVCSNFVARMPVATGCDGRYLAYVFRALYVEGRNIPHVKQTSGIQNLDSESYLNERAWLPAKDTQRHVAMFLDEQTARIDALIAQKDKLLSALVESEASQLLAHVTGKMHGATGELSPDQPDARQLPQGWKLPQLARLVSKLTNGFVGPTRDILVPTGVRYLQSLHIKSGQIDFSRGEYYVEETWSEAHAKSVLRAGDILIVQTGDIGQTAVVTGDFAGCNCHALIIASPRLQLVVPEYLELVLRSAYGRAAFDLYATGALHPHLNCSNIRDIRIPVPPVPVQREITADCLRVQEAHRELRAHVLRHIERLREYRSALISAAVTGQLNIGTYEHRPERLAA